jgi:hypothetical protein
MTEKEAKAKLKEIKKAMESFPKEIRRQERAHREEMKIRKAFGKLSFKIAEGKPKALPKRKNNALPENDPGSGKKVHPWRLCSYGKHAVRTHPLHVEPSQKHPDGKTTRHYHCALNKNRKDVLFPLEMEIMADEHFSSLTGAPKADDLGYDNGNAYDRLIRGWTEYWNEVLNPLTPLDPDWVKALIATESAFDPEAGIRPKRKKAKGLMQLFPETMEALRDEHGELKDHFVNLAKIDIENPNLTIAAGIRWLFRKQETASSTLGQAATWDQATVAYKAYQKTPNNQQMQKLRTLYQRLKK